MLESIERIFQPVWENGLQNGLAARLDDLVDQ
jgi:hypothetical protein